MGQKVNPISFRLQNICFPVLSSDSFFNTFSLRQRIIDYFFKKGFFVNIVNIFFSGPDIYLRIEILPSKRSRVFLKGYRRRLKKQKHFFKNSKHINLGLNRFLQSICDNFGFRNAYLRIFRLEKSFQPKLVKYFWSSVCKRTGFYFRKTPMFLDLFRICCAILCGRGTSYLLNQFLVSHFSILQKRKQKRFLYFLQKMFLFLLRTDAKQFRFRRFLGLKLLVVGRIAGKMRGSKFSISYGKIPNQKVNSLIDFSSLTSFSKLGTYGFKFWIARKRKILKPNFRKISFLFQKKKEDISNLISSAKKKKKMSFLRLPKKKKSNRFFKSFKTKKRQKNFVRKNTFLSRKKVKNKKHAKKVFLFSTRFSKILFPPNLRGDENFVGK